MRRRRLGMWMLIMAGLVVPRPAWAQAKGMTPRVSIGAGAGIANPLHGDLDFTPWAWDADVRLAMSRHLLVEVATGEWRHRESTVRTNLPVTPGNGVIGRLEETTTRAQRSVQGNILFTAARGRVRMTAGGGVGFLTFDRRTRQATSDCSPQVQCGVFESSFSNISAAAQIVGGAEVRVVGGLAIYGQLRFVVPATDPGGSDLRMTAGLRWGFGG